MSELCVLIVICGMVFTTCSPRLGMAQQINFNSFNGPQAAPASQISNACPIGTNILFCGNYAANSSSPAFISDFYPPLIDPNAAADGNAGSTNYALQLTPNSQSQNASVWFEKPQNVVDGFTTWYIVKINHTANDPSNDFSADGLAFVIQRAGGGQTDTLGGCPETGAGPSVLGSGGGCIGYGGIDNSVALEMDTFWDNWDPQQLSQGYSYDDNHLALQSCGLDGNGNPVANSPVHIGTPNCLLSLGGTSTLIQNPITSVTSTGTSNAVTLADGNPHQIVMVYNGPGDSPANFLSVYLDAAYDAGTHNPVAGSVPLFSGPFDITQYMKLSNRSGPYSPAYVGFTAANGGDWEQHEVMGWTFAPHLNPPNFGNVNVCPAGQTTPTPCSKVLNFTYNFPNGATLGIPQVVTQGVAGLDFSLNFNATTCIGAVAPGSCTVSVTFAPLAPGSRTGAVHVVDATGNVLASTLIYGVGQGPAVAFGRSTQTPVGTGSYLFNQPKGLAADAAGNLYIADTGSHNDGNRSVVKIAPDGTQTAIGTGLAFPQGIAVDGAGNLFVADNDLNQVVKIPYGCTSSSCQQVLATPQCVIGVSGLCAQLGVAVDGPGNVFISSFNSQVLEIPANGGAQTMVYNPAGSKPVGIAVDALGNLFLTDVGLHSVVEIPVGCAVTSCQISIGSGWSQPNDVAVDAAGDVFVTDSALQQVVEVPFGCTSASCQIVLVSGVVSGAITVDAVGNVFADDLSTNTIYKINRSQVPSLTFAATNVGVTSSDSPRSVTLQNIGNQPLEGQFPGLLIVAGPDFVNVPNTGTSVDCSTLSSIAPAAACNLSVSFTPQSPGTFGSVAVFHDNALNASSATQTIALSGSAILTTYQLTVSGNGSGTGTITDSLGQIKCFKAAVGAGVGTCTSFYPGGTQVTLIATPTGTSKFEGWGGVCASSGTSSTCTTAITTAAFATAVFVEPNAGSVNVCTTPGYPGQCSTTVPVTFVLPTTTNIGALQVVTQGIAGLDFTLGSGGTCVGTVVGGTACNLMVNFGPTAPGLRMGAVQMFDSNGNLVASTQIYGVGLEPEVAFDPGFQTTLASNTPNVEGVAVDAAGNIFIAGVFGAIKQTASGVQTPLSVAGMGQNGFYDVALDGAGNAYLADSSNNRIVVLSPSGVQTTLATTGLAFPTGVKIDGPGNVFITDRDNNRVVKVTPGGVQTTVPTSGLIRPYFPAVDAVGDVFFLDNGSQRLLKVTPNGVQTTVPINGLVAGNGVAVDAAGDIFVSDQLLNKVFEITPAGTQTTLATNGLSVAAGLAVDAAGNVFVAVHAQNRVVKVARSQPPAISFATTNVGSTSADSPVNFTIQNVGNQPLVGSVAFNLGASFTQNSSTDCSVNFPLAPGGICGESFSFTPQSATFLSGSATFTDNTLNTYPNAMQTVPILGVGATNGVPGTVAVPDVVGQSQAAAASPIGSAGLAMGTISTASSQAIPSGSIISENPVAGTQVSVGSTVNLLVSSGLPTPPSPNPLLLENNYFLTGDYVSAGVTLRGTGNLISKIATGTITIPNYTQNSTLGVPDGADVVDAFLYWQTLENTALPSSTNGTFNGYSIAGQQIGGDIPNYTDGGVTGTLRSYRASVNIYLPNAANGTRTGSGSYKISLPDSGGSTYPLTEGASLVLVYRVLSPNFPLKSVVIYDGSALASPSAVQVVQGFYDAVGGVSGIGKNTTISTNPGAWHDSVLPVTLGQSNQYTAPLTSGAAYTAVILSTPVNNSDNDGILDAWKTGPTGSDFHTGQPGYYDVKTSTWVGLPGAKHGQKDLFVQLDYMCGAVLASGACDPNKENLFPSPDVNGNDPLAMVQQAFAASGVQLHLQVGNAVPEDTCVDTPGQLCQFPNQPGVIGWKNSLEYSKLYPRNLAACITGGDCTTRFPFGQKDSYHYVLFGHSLAISGWNSRFGSLMSIKVASGETTIVTTDRGTGINLCTKRLTIGGVLGAPLLNGVYDAPTCPDSRTITVHTPGVPDYTYPNAVLPEPVIGITFGQVTSISGYSDLGGADSAVTLGLWLTAPNQDMSRKANVVAGTLFHEIGHTLGLSHGGLYYDVPASYVPTFEANCKPNYQSIMNYLFQLDGVGPNQAIAFSNQTLSTLNETSAGSVKLLTDLSNSAATFSTSAWYVPYLPGAFATPATRHCDGTPLAGDSAYRVDASIAPITPPWTNGQDLNFTGVLQTKERGFNDLTNMDLRQIGATGGQFAALASALSFGSSVAPLNISAGGTVTLGSGGTAALGSGGTVTLGSGGNVTLGSSGTVTLGNGGTVTLGSGGNVTVPAGSAIAPGSSGTVTLGSGGTVTLGSGGTVTLGSGGTVTLGSGGTVTLGSGGTITLGSGGAITVPATGGTYSIDGNGGTVTLGSGGTVTLGSGGVATLSSGGTVTLGSGGTVTLGSGGTVTLGSGGTVTLGSGGTVTLGSGGTVTLGSGGTVTLGSGGNTALSSGGTVTLGSGGSATLGAGGTVTLGSGGTVTLGSGNATLSSGGTVTLGSGGTVTLGSGGTVTLGSGGTVTLGSGGVPVLIGAGGTVTLGSGGTVTLGSGGTVTLGSGGTVTLGSGGTVTLGSGGTVTLGSGGTVTLGSGGVVTLGTGGSISLGSGSSLALAPVSNITPSSSGPTTTDELTYETANSVVRPPSLPTETMTLTGVRITWKAPAFGVVQTYTIYRSSNGSTPVAIGSVSGVNGFPPATQFTDTNPDRVSLTVVYTISTLLAPDTAGAAPRQSPVSPPAVIKNDQSIVLGPLPSSAIIASPLTISATALSNGAPNGLQVLFSATGSCAIGSQSLANNVSSATVTLNTVGMCTVTASQPGSTAFNAANSASGTFIILPVGSTTQSQTITFAPLQNVQYGNSFSLKASSSAGLPVIFTAAGPCSTGGNISGVGICTITASAPASSTYSATSLTQAFVIYPAVLKVTASNLTSIYKQSLPTLTYSYTGFLKNDPASVVSGTPTLATTATPASTVGNYPITVSTGSLAAANYSFLYVNGTLTVQSANQAALVLNTTSPLTYGQSETLSVAGGTTGGAVTYNVVGGACSIAGSKLTATSGTGTCQVTATMAGNNNYYPVTSTPVNTVMLSPSGQTITFTIIPPASAVYKSTFTVAATGGASGNAVTFTSAGACSNAGAVFTITNTLGTCSVIANQAGNLNYVAAATVSRAVTATVPLLTLSTANIDFGTVYLRSIKTQNITVTNVGTGPATINDPFLSIVKGGTSDEFIALNLCPKPLAVGKNCTIIVGFIAGPYYTPQSATLQVMSNSPGSPQPVTLSAKVINPISRLNATSLNFGTVRRATSSTLNVVLSNPGGTPLLLTGIGVRGANASSFVQSNNCGTSVAAGAACTISIKFAPSTAGSFSATLTIGDNAQTGGGIQSVALSGSGS